MTKSIHAEHFSLLCAQRFIQQWMPSGPDKARGALLRLDALAAEVAGTGEM